MALQRQETNNLSCIIVTACCLERVSRPSKKKMEHNLSQKDSLRWDGAQNPGRPRGLEFPIQSNRRIVCIESALNICKPCGGNARSRPTLCDPMDCSPPESSVHGIFPAKNTEVDCHFLLQRVSLTQGSHPESPALAIRFFTICRGCPSIFFSSLLVGCLPKLTYRCKAMHKTIACLFFFLRNEQTASKIQRKMQKT